MKTLARKTHKRSVIPSIKDIYEIAKLIVDDFDANKLKNINDDDHLKLVNKVQEQAANDGINVTDSVSGGAVKKAVQEKQAKA